MERISEHISYEEATRSQTATRLGIKNMPGEAELKNMEIVAKACFEPLREWYGKPLTISSFFRCKELNDAIKGSKTSQHVQGKAIDIDTGSRKENTKLLNWAKANLKYDQLICEYPDANGDPSWVHISFEPTGKNRNQFLTIK